MCFISFLALLLAVAFYFCLILLCACDIVAFRSSLKRSVATDRWLLDRAQINKTAWSAARRFLLCFLKHRYVDNSEIVIWRRCDDVKQLKGELPQGEPHINLPYWPGTEIVLCFGKLDVDLEYVIIGSGRIQQKQTRSNSQRGS